MKIHVLIDYSFLYYKYKFRLDSGKIRRLKVVLGEDGKVVDSSVVELFNTVREIEEAEEIIKAGGEATLRYTENAIQAFKESIKKHGNLVEKDISQIFYSIKEIEGVRKQLEKVGHEVVVSVCFDMPSGRKETSDSLSESETEVANAYKSSRVKRLGDSDFADIRIVEELMSKAGHNTYRFELTEADDIIAGLLKKYKDSFDYSVIYTPDADLLVNIDTKVGAQRFKTTKGYQPVDINNFSEYMSKEMKCYIPYNALMLYKSTVGDKSDDIAGIRGFGPKAFDKLVAYLTTKGINWVECGTYEKTLELLELSRGYLSDDNINQAIDCLSMVRPMIIEEGLLAEPNKVSNRALREKSYMRYNMKSLVD